ncbi:MAG: transglutaminase domain-containing protein [Bacteroidota bacterium]
MNFEGYSIKKKESQEKDMKVVSFEISDLEEFPKAANLPGSSYYMPHILVLTKSYTWSNTKYDILSSTESLYKWYKSLVDLSKFNPEALRALVDRVTAGSKSDEDKIKAIYYWVQDNIKYIAFEDGLAGFKPEDSDQVYAKKYGDCKGMANLTKDMLRIAGFDARLSWIGTDRIAYTYDMPSLAVDNHMICAVKLNDQFLFLDATEKHHSIKEYAERLQGKQVLIEDGDSFIIEQIPEEPMGKYLNTTNVSYSFNDESLNAEVVENIQGEYKRGLINIFEAVPNQKLNLFYKSIAAGNLETDDVNMLNEPALKRDSTLELHYNLNMKNHLNKFGNEVYLDLDYKKDLKNSEIEEDRKVPFKFSTKINRKLKGELVIPEGLAVSHLPEAYQVSSDYFEFNLSYEVIGNKINYTKELRVLKTYMPVDQFPDWNKAISNVTKFYNDQIILTSK